MTATTAENVSLLGQLVILGSMGCTLGTRDGKLLVSNRRSLGPAVIEAIKRHRDDLLRLAQVPA